LGRGDENSPLPFSVFSVLAVGENGQLMTAKIKSLIRLFRPDRSGELTRLDYSKSIDTVYKELRLLRASIANSAQIDIAFEKIVNAFFYFFVTIIAITILGIDIWSVFLSINTLILGASFLFGSAASNYFEGLLLIFVRRPYDIGDKVSLQGIHGLSVFTCLASLV
jgi:small-conductance mechanosensitive channel